MEVIGTEAEVDRSSAKVAILAALGVVLALVFSYFLSQLIVGVPNTTFLALLFAVLFLSVFSLQSILIKSHAKLYYIALFEALALVVWFYAIPPFYVFLSFISAFCFLALGVYHQTRELGERLKIRISKVAREGIKNGLSAISLFVVLVYLGGVSASGELLSQGAFQRLISPAFPLVQIIYPEIVLDEPFAVVAKNIAESQIQAQPEAAFLTPSQLNAFVSESVQALHAQFVEFLGITFSVSDTVLDILYQWFLAKFTALPSTVQTWIWITIGIASFLALRGTSLIFMPLLLLFTFLVFELMLFTGFAVKFAESRSREFVVLK